MISKIGVVRAAIDHAVPRLARCSRPDAAINDTIMHVAGEDLPFRASDTDSESLRDPQHFVLALLSLAEQVSKSGRCSIGMGASGTGAHHRRAGFEAFSHCRWLFVQSRLSGTRMLPPPYGRIAGFAVGGLIGKPETSARRMAPVSKDARVAEVLIHAERD